MIKEKVIKCPHCGAEYLPAEIFYPDILGNPRDITKTSTGEIVGFRGESLNLTETYECDYCYQQFIAKISMNFSAEPFVDIFAEDDDFKDVVEKEN